MGELRDYPRAWGVEFERGRRVGVSFHRDWRIRFVVLSSEEAESSFSELCVLGRRDHVVSRPLKFRRFLGLPFGFGTIYDTATNRCTRFLPFWPMWRMGYQPITGGSHALRKFKKWWDCKEWI